MRHISRTHRVALDWLIDRINLDHIFKSVILTPNTNSQTCWLKWISHVMSGTIFFISACCTKNFSVTSCSKAMAKRMQEQKEEDRTVAKAKLTAMNLTSTASTSSSSVNHSTSSKSPGILKASTGKPDARARRNSKLDAASSSLG